MTQRATRGRAAVGFVGLGNMGWPMAENLCAAGFPLVVHDLAEGTATRFVDDHPACELAPSFADVVSRSSFVVTMLPDGHAVRRLMLDDTDTVVPALRRPGAPVLVDMGSSDPVGTVALASALAEAGVTLVDAPVSGGVARARAGELSILVGGSEDVLAHCEPVLRSMGSNVFHVGPVGAGHAMKALNNLMSAAGLLIAAETLTIGARFGLDMATMLDVLNASTGRNHATETKFAQHVGSGTYASGFAAELMLKDLRIARGIAQATRTPAPIGALVTDLWAIAKSQLPAGADQMRVVAWLEQVADVQLAPDKS